MSEIMKNTNKRYTRDAIHLLALKKPVTVEFYNNFKASGYIIELGNKYELIPFDGYKPDVAINNNQLSGYYLFDINAIKNIKYYANNQDVDKEIYV